ncbi:hypothetical protein N7520_010408 [Penicillium odoratum]|uniref:uncharacterized protein n=1 Tax=Penicillium odoratum TaxID=1167516 RepID=UPI0025495DA9|nr:uncharacterized protein N7520_010408 [Penicillium odoratum]KAJ5745226.1 hypothetical protein N7520_010408 [Penicillium odoratum]
MSNFMHKVKDAMTDRDKEDRTYRDDDNYGSNAPGTETNNPSDRPTNPFGHSRGDTTGSHTRFNEPSNVDSTNTKGSHNTGPTGSDSYASARSGATNAGPHDSATANKLDPRVDSDQDHRANQGTMGSRSNVGPHDSAMANKMDPRVDSDQAFDNHKKSEENYSKATQEHKAHTQPGEMGNELKSEDDYSSSLQENKTHSTTSHAAPCQEAGGLGGQQGMAGQQGMGGQQGFGGNAAAGGSGGMGMSGGQGGVQSQGQNVDPMNKLDPRVTRANEQQSNVGNQRGY